MSALGRQRPLSILTPERPLSGVKRAFQLDNDTVRKGAYTANVISTLST